MKGGLKKSILVEIMSWNVMDEVVLQSPEGVSAVGPPATRSSCHPGPRSVDLYPWHFSLNKKKTAHPKKNYFEFFNFWNKWLKKTNFFIILPPLRGHFLAFSYHIKWEVLISGFMPYTQLNTIDLCTITFITDDTASRKQVNSHMITGLLYSNIYKHHVYYPSSKNWDLDNLFGPAPVLSWGRATGVIWEIS